MDAVPYQQAALAFRSQPGADGNVAVLEREGKGIVRAHGVDNAHYAVMGDDAGLLLDAVLIPAVQDKVVMLLVPADFGDFRCREAESGARNKLEGIDPQLPQLFLCLKQLLL